MHSRSYATVDRSRYNITPVWDGRFRYLSPAAAVPSPAAAAASIARARAARSSATSRAYRSTTHQTERTRPLHTESSALVGRSADSAGNGRKPKRKPFPKAHKAAPAPAHAVSELRTHPHQLTG